MARTQITTAVTTLVKTGAGKLRIISLGGGTMGAITAYDALTATGTPIWAKTLPIDGEVYQFNIPFGIGLTIVTAAATKVNILWDNGNRA